MRSPQPTILVHEDNAVSVIRVAPLKENTSGAVRAGERVFLSAGNAVRPDGSVSGLGDPAAQTHAALDQLQTALEAAGGSLRSITKLTTCIVDRGYRTAVYAAIAAAAEGGASGQHRARGRRPAAPRADRSDRR